MLKKSWQDGILRSREKSTAQKWESVHQNRVLLVLFACLVLRPTSSHHHCKQLPLLPRDAHYSFGLFLSFKPHINCESGREESSLITHQGYKKYWTGLFSYTHIETYNVKLHGSKAKAIIKANLDCVCISIPKSSKQVSINQWQNKPPIALNKDTY